MSSSVIVSAGGLVLDERGWILITHNARKGWELPKGRVEPGESRQETAIREVLEETGYTCSCEKELPPVYYKTPSGHMKCVYFWKMRMEEQTSSTPPDDRFDQAMWCSLEDALRRVRHVHQRQLIEQYARTP